MQYTISGIPVPLQRPRYYNDRVYDSQRHTKHQIAFELERQHTGPLHSGPLQVHLMYYFPISTRIKGAKREAMLNTPVTKVPDLDNLIKMTLDCANKVCWNDDCQIVNIQAVKLYGDPCTKMIITPYKAE
jgi:Holliday junction resolvase RusA-like endonuclease